MNRNPFWGSYWPREWEPPTPEGYRMGYRSRAEEVAGGDPSHPPTREDSGGPLPRVPVKRRVKTLEELAAEWKVSIEHETGEPCHPVVAMRAAEHSLFAHHEYEAAEGTCPGCVACEEAS